MRYLFLSCALALALGLSAQENKIDTSFQLVNETGTRNFPVEVASGESSLAVVFTGEISAGGIEVELINPGGKRESGFELNSNSGQTLKIVTGSGNKNDNSNSSTSVESDEETVVSVRKGSKTTSISAGSNSVSLSSDDGEILSISSDSGVSVIKSSYMSEEDTGAKGVMVETIDNPSKGKWVIRMKSADVTGTINLVISRG